MVKKIYLCAFALAVLTSQFACKQKQMVALPGAVVSKDGTDDGLHNVQREFDDAVRTDEGIRFTLSSDVLFAINSSYLSDIAKAELDKVAALLKQEPGKRIRVDGHTDATGEADYNQWLSEKRAESVKTYLENVGIPRANITAQGRGQHTPVADNKTADGRKLNRRVEIVILN